MAGDLLFLTYLFFLTVGILTTGPSDLTSKTRLLGNDRHVTILGRLNGVREGCNIHLTIIAIGAAGGMGVNSCTGRLLSDACASKGGNGVILILTVSAQSCCMTASGTVHRHVDSGNDLPILRRGFLPLLGRGGCTRTFGTCTLRSNRLLTCCRTGNGTCSPRSTFD